MAIDATRWEGLSHCCGLSLGIDDYETFSARHSIPYLRLFFSREPCLAFSMHVMLAYIQMGARLLTNVDLAIPLYPILGRYDTILVDSLQHKNR